MGSVCTREFCHRQLVHWTKRSVRERLGSQFKFFGAVIFTMFVHQTARFRLTKLLAILHVLLAYLSLPLAASGDNSVALPDRPRPERRVPALSFKIIEGSGHGGLPIEAHAVPHRRSHYYAVNKDKNHVLQRVPVSFRRRIHYRWEDSNESHGINENKNVNLSDYSNTNTYRNRNSFLGSHIGDMRFEDDTFVIKLQTKLSSCVTFRANMITVFGQILKARNNRLTIDQFTSLNLILQTLIHKQVYIFNLLPILEKLQNTDKVTQFKLVIQALANNVPIYVACACTFWLNEIENHRVDIRGLITSIDKPADFLAGLDPEVIDICKVKVAAEEMEPFDEPSKVTQETLGSVFVNIFHKLKNHKITLSQKLFGAILINLPIGKLNPVLEEYINYIWDMTQNGLLPNWNVVARDIVYGNPYEIVMSVTNSLLMKEDTPDILKHALKYIILHLKEVTSTFSDEYYSDMQALLNNDKNMELLFYMIQDDLTIPKLGDLKDRMIIHMKSMNIDGILQGMNKYTYQKPIDILIALLARIHSRTQNVDIRNTVSNLLSILILKKELGSLTVTVPCNVDLTMLLDFLNVPDSDSAISALGKKIQHYLDGDLNLLINLQNLVLKKHKINCQRPIQCLLNVFKEIMNPNTAHHLGVPTDFLMMIKKLVDLIKNATNSSVKCDSHNIMTCENADSRDDLVNVVLQPILQAPGSTSKPVLPQFPSSIGTSTQWPMFPTIPTNTDSSISQPNYPNSRDDKVMEIVYPIYPDGGVKDPSYPTVPIYDTIFPTDCIIKPIPVGSLESQPKPTSIPEYVPTVKATTIPQIMQTHKLPIIPLVKPLINPSIPLSTLSPKKPPLLTTPESRPTMKTPANHPPNNLPPQTEREPVLPPNLSYDRPMYIVFPKGDEPPYTVLSKPNSAPDSGEFLEFPSIKELLQGFDLNTPFRPDELPDVSEVLEPLKQMLGPNYIELLLGKRVDKAEYPTAISLMNDVLNHALLNPKVKGNSKLVLTIQKYLKGIIYICITALFPVVIDSQKISSDVLHVTFDPNNPNANSVDSKPPQRIPFGFITLTIYHPKYLTLQVDPVNPYGTLLPSPDEGEDNPIQDLINDGSLQEILGPDFDPLLYPNRGTLLAAVLQKLMISPRLKSDPWLLMKLYAYLKSIKAVALYSKIPNNYSTYILQLQQNNKINWQPNTASLILALPPARNQQEFIKIKLIKAFLETPNLLELLKITIPSYSTTRGALLKMIFNAAIWGGMVVLDPNTFAALKYYESKILTKGYGALPIVWVWVQMFIIREQIPLGQIIEAVLDYDSLPYDLKISYNDLMTYLSDNPQFLQGNDDFPFKNYPTKGTFLKGLFSYFLTKPDMSLKSKMQLIQMIPYISLTGHGAEQMHYATLDDITNGKIDKNRFSVLLNG